MTVPRVAVLTTGLAGALVVATMHPLPAQALPRYASACSACHGAVTARVSTAVPSKTALTAGASYTVRIALAAGGRGPTGYWISGPGGVSGGPSSSLTYTATMRAPATAGLKTYRVWTRQGNRVGSVTYKITVSVPVRPIQFGRIQYNAPGADRATNASINSEYVVIQNRGTVARSLTGWTVRDAQAHIYTFGTFTLAAKKSVVLRTGKGVNTATTRYWGLRYHVWGNTADKAILRAPATTANTDYCAWTTAGPGYKVC
jgi:hypothetical protein